MIVTKLPYLTIYFQKNYLFHLEYFRSADERKLNIPDRKEMNYIEVSGSYGNKYEDGGVQIYCVVWY
jgi:hypothetical protein